MKTITNGVIVKRCDDVTAAQNVKKGWKYCPKSEWKKLERANNGVQLTAASGVTSNSVNNGGGN